MSDARKRFLDSVSCPVCGGEFDLEEMGADYSALDPRSSLRLHCVGSCGYVTNWYPKTNLVGHQLQSEVYTRRKLQEAESAALRDKARAAVLRKKAVRGRPVWRGSGRGPRRMGRIVKRWNGPAVAGKNANKEK